MSVREYVGARYVPTFATPIDWNSANTYEPLTIVLHEGNSYTSRQAVPAGIQITNTTYWAQTGNYNAQIEQYRQDVAALANKFPVSVLDGGTGGTDAATARTNLDAAQADGATNSLYDAEQAIAANAAGIISLQNSAIRTSGISVLACESGNDQVLLFDIQGTQYGHHTVYFDEHGFGMWDSDNNQRVGRVWWDIGASSQVIANLWGAPLVCLTAGSALILAGLIPKPNTWTPTSVRVSGNSTFDLLEIGVGASSVQSNVSITDVSIVKVSDTFVTVGIKVNKAITDGRMYRASWNIPDLILS